VPACFLVPREPDFEAVGAIDFHAGAIADG
jgi:hypothetical protein